MAQATPWHADDDGDRRAPAIALLRGVVHELIEPGRSEVVELHFGDRPLPRDRRPDRDAEDRILGNRRVDDAVAELLQQRTQQEERAAIEAADILTVDEDARIGAKCIGDTCHYGFEERRSFLVE